MISTKIISLNISLLIIYLCVISSIYNAYVIGSSSVSQDIETHTSDGLVKSQTSTLSLQVSELHVVLCDDAFLYSC